MTYKKLTATTSEMSNLVGMYAYFIDKNDKKKATIFIKGKADNKYFICQFVSVLGDPNIAKLMTLDELKDWVIIPNVEIANETIEEYVKNGWGRYKIDPWI